MALCVSLAAQGSHSINANLAKYGLKIEKDPEHPAKKRFAVAQ